MKKTIPLFNPEEYSYPYAGEFLPNITAYLHEDDAIRPFMLVVPGGGYAGISSFEGEIVAKKFYHAGYQAFVLTYTTNMYRLKPLEKQPLKEISRAVRYIRKHSRQMRIRPNMVACCGFSAGGHLVGSLAVHYRDEALSSEPYADISNRPDAVVLCYPVITSGEYAHAESFELLLGPDPTPEAKAWASLEKNVSASTPPSFLWQTITDELVPVENSILYAKACRENHVPCELHLFMEGKHGLSLADEDWANGNLGEGSEYTMLQHWQTARTLHAQNPALLPEMFAPLAQAETLSAFMEQWNHVFDLAVQPEPNKPDPAVAKWPELALGWLDKVLSMSQRDVLSDSF